MLQVDGDPHGLSTEEDPEEALVPKKWLLSKALTPQLPRTRMRNVLYVGKHLTHAYLWKFGCSASFASFSHMRHALRVQNIISVTTVTMSRLMRFVI